MKSKTLEYKVRYILAGYPKTRDSDITLTQYIWWVFHNSSLIEIDGDIFVNVKDLHKLPREDNIKRIRARIQNEENLYLPTKPEIAVKRKWNEQEWRKLLGYQPNNLQEQEYEVKRQLKQIGLL